MQVNGVEAYVCRYCSTRSTLVTIPLDEGSEHDAWHAAQLGVTVERMEQQRREEYEKRHTASDGSVGSY